MKQYVLVIVLFIVLFVVGCEVQKIEVQDEKNATEEILSSNQTTLTSVLDETTNVEALEEDLSPSDNQEDDYGDII